ncbi:MAG: (Fe-S)-binding protein, partial [Acidimicrobiales bacterium]
MATYKAEFLSHYYKGRLRPASAYAMGLIPLWARAASLAPRVANAVARNERSGALLKSLGGIAPQRGVPSFARRTFTSWFRGRREVNPAGDPVLLFPDTFTNCFHPEIAVAATEVLEAAGRRVVVPAASLCCGRPLYDYGMLDLAERFLRRILDQLRPHITAGVPMVVLEPSCAAVFRDELTNLLPHDQDARRLHDQTFMLSELLANRCEGFRPPALSGRALVQAHCHQKAVIGIRAEQELLERMGLDVEVPDSGCCGMAGSFGFEEGEHYRVSVAAGERVILPKVREASPTTIVVAAGFSCREQIAQGTDRRALHPAEVLRLAMRDGPQPPKGLPENAARGDDVIGRSRTRALVRAAASAASVSLSAATALPRKR